MLLSAERTSDQLLRSSSVKQALFIFGHRFCPVASDTLSTFLPPRPHSPTLCSETASCPSSTHTEMASRNIILRCCESSHVLVFGFQLAFFCSAACAAGINAGCYNNVIMSLISARASYNVVFIIVVCVISWSYHIDWGFSCFFILECNSVLKTVVRLLRALNCWSVRVLFYECFVRHVTKRSGLSASREK